MGGTSGTSMNGSLVVAHGREAGELAQFGRRTERFEWLDGEGIAALEPDLGGRFGKALFFREEGHLDPRAALAALREPTWRAGSANPFWRHCGRRAADGGQRVGCGRVSCAVGLQGSKANRECESRGPVSRSLP